MTHGVLERSNGLQQCGGGVHKCLVARNVKVTEDWLSSRRDEDVFQLQIPVNNTVDVQILKCHHYEAKRVAQLIARRTFGLEPSHHGVRVKWQHQEALIALSENGVQLDNERMVETLQHVELLVKACAVLLLCHHA